MIRDTLRKLTFAASALLVCGAFVGCEENKTPMQRAGDDLSKAGKNAAEAVNPPSTPGEKAGSAIDHATGNK